MTWPWWGVVIAVPVFTVCAIAVIWFWFWVGNVVPGPWDIWRRRKR